jgi:hypothetical protein
LSMYWDDDKIIEDHADVEWADKNNVD